MTTYLLKSRPPIRAYAIGAVLTAAGAVLMVTGGAATWLVVLGGVVLVAGVALVAAGILAQRRMAVTVELDATGYRILGAGGEGSGDWADVTRVTQSDGGARLTLHHGPERRTVLVAPSGHNDPDLVQLAKDIATRLDADRGYGRNLTAE